MVHFLHKSPIALRIGTIFVVVRCSTNVPSVSDRGDRAMDEKKKHR